MRASGLVAACAALGASWGAAHAQDAADLSADVPIVFANVRVLPMTGEGALEAQTVVVDGDRIAYVGPDADAAPEGARIIDGAGRTLMPGLADMHLHYDNDEDGLLYLANGVTAVRSMWGNGAALRRDTIAKLGVHAGPHVHFPGPLMDGPGSRFRGYALDVTSPEAARGAVEALSTSGFGAVKLYDSMDEATYRAAVAKAKELGMQVWTHTPHAMTVEDVLELRVDSIEHLHMYQFAMAAEPADRSAAPPNEWWRIGWELMDEARMADLVARIVDAGVWSVPTLTVYTQASERQAATDAFFARPELRYVHPNIMGRWGAIRQWAENDGAEETQTNVDAYRAGEEARARLVKALYDAGAGLLVGSDSPNAFIEPGYGFHDELGNLSAAGVPNDALLRMATTEAARFFGEEGEFGVVAEGARADLILVEGDPLADLSVLRVPDQVMVNGHLWSRADLQSALDALAARWAAPAD